MNMRLLDRYVQITVLRTFILVGIGLVSLFSLFDFVEQLRSVGEAQYGAFDALEYVLLTAPGRFIQLTPPSVLLASLLGLGAMAASGELTALRSLGISRNRIVAWVLELTVLILVLLFVIAEFVAPASQRIATYQRDAKVAPSGAIVSKGGFWARGEHGYVNVHRLTHEATTADIDIFVFRDDGTIGQFTHAENADVLDDGTWQLRSVTTKTFEDDRVLTERAESKRWTSFLSPQQVKLLTTSPEAMAPTELWAYVRTLKRQHQHTIRFEQQLWSLISIPLASVAMILVSIPFVFGSLRGVSLGQRITVGILIGLIFSLIQQIVNYVGLLLDLNPAFPALAPSLLILSGLAVLAQRGIKP